MKTKIINVSWLKIMFGEIVFSINARIMRIIIENDDILASSKYVSPLNLAPILKCGFSMILNEDIGVK